MAAKLRPSAGDRLRYSEIRTLSRTIAAPLSDADATLQPMPDASPAKWHLAHTSWFFETFVLRDHVSGYASFDDRFAYLFNSYYEGEGERHARPRRGMLSRPSLEDILAYRAHVDGALSEALPRLGGEALGLVELGLHHEQQHQELMLMDILATFFENPLRPACWDGQASRKAPKPKPLTWIKGRTGIVEIGHDRAGFAFDSEGPRHPILLRPHALADRSVTNGEWLNFIDERGYSRPELWLSDGWAWAQENRNEAPLYWIKSDKEWTRFGLDGVKAVNWDDPVCHVSYFEADAFARWSGARLPTEGEWEAAAALADPSDGNQLDAAGPVRPGGQSGWFGDVWQWTMSAFLPHPGFAPAEGTVGEYNGKFMSGQMVLKGASCATPRGHSRASYRNFFYPHQRWQFAGLRLAKDL
ncbi:MAG: ergothioneine biosynthesis protein EgtB [Sphingosinicella sp.]|nr:ergothioneine biosynthesis protein EgtB [Sphingosinicella sp.]